MLLPRLDAKGSIMQSQGHNSGELEIAPTSGRQQVQQSADVGLPAIPRQNGEPGGAVVAEHPAQQQRERLLEERPVVVSAQQAVSAGCCDGASMCHAR